MRHRRTVKKLNRNTSNRKALLRSLARGLIINERILTTHAKAKQASSFADRLISLGKRNTMTSKKTAISILGSKDLINKLFDDIAPRFTSRNGGYTRILKLATRKGDGAKIVILELTERKIEEKTPVKKPLKKDSEVKKVPPQDEKKEEKTAHKAPKEENPLPQAPVPPKKEQVAAKEILDEEKTKERAKSEKEKLQKGFFKGLNRYFRRKSF